MTTTRSPLSEAMIVSEDACAFLNVYIAARDLSVDDLLYMFEKPWKWDTEFALWLNNGKPADPWGSDYDTFSALLDELR